MLDIIKIFFKLLIPLEDNSLLQELIERITLVKNLSYEMMNGLDFTFKTPQGFDVMRQRHINNSFDLFKVNLDTSLGHDKT